MPDPHTESLVNEYSRLTLKTENRNLSKDERNLNSFEKIIRPHHRARDVTEDFRNACENLEIGQLVKDENFTLFESVQAMEVMDPKMDSGCLAEGESLDDDFDVYKTLSLAQVIGIIDQILCYEAAWHRGYPLSQTLFTSIHINTLLNQKRAPKAFPLFQTHYEEGSGKQQEIINLVLRAYCIGVIKTCDIVLEMVTTQHYYEEEDLTTQTYQKDLLTDLPDEECAALLDEACFWILDRRKGWMRQTIRVFYSNESSIQDPYHEALYVRLEARKAFLKAFLQAEIDENPPAQRWCDQRDRYMAIKDSHTLADSIPDAFSSKMHRKLASTAPPRPPIALDFGEAIEDLMKMCEDLAETSYIGNYEHNASPESIRSFLWSFSARNPPPSTFPRTSLQALLLADGRPAGHGGINTLILNEIRETVIPMDFIVDGSFWEVEVPTDPRYEVARKFDWFFEQGAPAFMDVYRALCQNRCRIRRVLMNVLPQFDDLTEEMYKKFTTLPRSSKDESEKAPRGLFCPLLNPSEINSHLALAENSLLAVVRLQSLRMMQWIVQLGFEHNVYQSYELGNMYRVLALVCGNVADILQTTMSVVVECQKDEWKNFGNGNLTVSEKDRRLTAQKLRILHIRKLRISSQALFAQGLCELYHFLIQQGAISLPSLQYSTHTLQYQLRIRPFLQLLNPPMYLPTDPKELEGDKEGSKLLIAADGSLEEAAKSFQSLLKERRNARELGVEGVEESWETDTKAVLRKVVGARLIVKRLKDWLSSSIPGENIQKPWLSIKPLDPNADTSPEGWWLDWRLPDISFEEVTS